MDSLLKSEGRLPPDCQINTLRNLHDLEIIAEKRLSPKAWLYLQSAAEDAASRAANRADWSRVWMRPRVLRDVTHVSTRHIIMGQDLSLPLFIAPCAMATLAHPEGEKCLAQAAVKNDILYCASTYTGIPLEELAPIFNSEIETRENRGRGALVFQLYVPASRKQGEDLIARARRLGCRALVVTVDCPVVGRREGFNHLGVLEDRSSDDGMSKSSASPPMNPSFTWQDLKWIKEAWGSGEVIIKGIQTFEDAVIAADSAGVTAIYLSNHGGRQLDYSQSPLRTLLEIHKYRPDILRKVKVYLDGGIRRGTDVVKAVALGATAVGIGRPFVQALGCFGTDGVCKVVEMLREEIRVTMQLLGVTSLNQLSPSYVNTRSLESEIFSLVDEETHNFFQGPSNP